MKKSIIFILLTVLVLGAFTACDGDVFEDLIGGNTITLEIPEEWYWMSFDSNNHDVKTKDVTIPSGCKTWADLLESVGIKFYDYNKSDEYTLRVYTDEKIYFLLPNDVPNYGYGLILSDAMVSYPDSTEAGANIVIGGTYMLTDLPH